MQMCEIKLFRSKYHSDQLADALIQVERMNTFAEIEELEQDFLNDRASKVYDESNEGEQLADRIRRHTESNMGILEKSHE
jgi:hypothetical protein